MGGGDFPKRKLPSPTPLSLKILKTGNYLLT
jgi:hypothetical protein